MYLLYKFDFYFNFDLQYDRLFPVMQTLSGVNNIFLIIWAHLGSYLAKAFWQVAIVFSLHAIKPLRI